MSFDDILFTIRSNEWYYIFSTAIILTITTLLISLLDKKASKQNISKSKKRRLIILILAFTFFSELISVAIPILFPFNNSISKDGISSEVTSDYEVLTEYRYDLYDNSEISKKINAINSDLAYDGKNINPDILKAFIYAMNGDYSLCTSNEPLNKVANIYTNLDIDLINIMRGHPLGNDSVTPINSLADIFCDPNDYEMVAFWQQYYNNICEEIYVNGPTEQTIKKCDEFCISLQRTFVGKEKIKISENKYSSIYNISDEAKFVILNCIALKSSDYIVSPNGGNRSEIIPFEKTTDESYTYIDIEVLSESIREVSNNVFTQLLINNGLCK